MSRKKDRIYFENMRDGFVLASRKNCHGVTHYGKGRNRAEATEALRRAEKGKIVLSTTQPQLAAE